MPKTTKKITTIPATLTRFTATPINQQKKRRVVDMPVFPQTTMTSSAATLRKLIITPTTLKVVTIGSLLRSTPTMESRGQRSTAPRSNGPCK